jgi:hypothetical protein
MSVAFTTGIRMNAVVQEILLNLGRGRTVAYSEVALAQAPVIQDRNVGVAERDLGRLGGTTQVRGEHCGDAVVASPATHLGSIGTSARAEAETRPIRTGVRAEWKAEHDGDWVGHQDRS